MFFFFNDTSTTEIYTLSLHDALPISAFASRRRALPAAPDAWPFPRRRGWWRRRARSEEHTSELQSRRDLVCRLLLEKKKNKRRRLPPRRSENPHSDHQGVHIACDVAG